MNKSNLLGGLIVILVVLFLLLDFYDEYMLSKVAKSLIVPSITLLYFINVTRKPKFFSWFLILFSISEITSFIEYFLVTDFQFDMYYTVGNLFYIAAYCCLIYHVYKTIDIKRILTNYKIHLIILGLLNAYIIYVLLTIVKPYTFGSYIFYIEFLYNIVMLVLLAISLLSYFNKDNKKSLFMFFGSLSIVFSEVIQVAYYYISEKYLLYVVSGLLFIGAFWFYYLYSKAKNENTFKLTTQV
ncbi:hypothetical protein [Mangrovimonas spongiae]|uniref:Lysoplasmalogenase n=1 Tax=Mangrovimonas spongiae TaxID=2494697 RepID=A0A3R9PHI8_9FLAO|nr:hypothetical protein [Mangrovimonas spongiae]RSK38295.1 hypothetical protein EJA19_12435 [Mangrovimonas spongiae]